MTIKSGTITTARSATDAYVDKIGRFWGAKVINDLAAQPDHAAPLQAIVDHTNIDAESAKYVVVYVLAAAGLVELPEGADKEDDFVVKLTEKGLKSAS